ncbi:hypothetical protein LSH36_597g00010 [Paralvinella palmiformis]|uniref:Uncharacterized protein n=1 Tax=Paralvinella palmiformis TaxID=53620 RepID=A0AAD9MXG0_9ANNE|nr:hypothetical protein LSH36_597g00010 [Paralvinella palmiformis]
MEYKRADVAFDPQKYLSSDIIFDNKQKSLPCSWLFMLSFYSGAVTAALSVLAVVGSLHVNKIEQYCDKEPAIDKAEDVEYIPDEDVKDTSWLPTEVQGVCAGKDTRWLNKNDALEGVRSNEQAIVKVYMVDLYDLAMFTLPSLRNKLLFLHKDMFSRNLSDCL